MADKIIFRPFIPLLLALMVGIVFGSGFPGHKIPAVCTIFLCLVHLLAAFIRKKSALIAPVTLFGALGYLLIQAWQAPAFPPHHVIHFQDTHPWKIIGIIDNDPVTAVNRLKFILRTETLQKKNVAFPIIGKIRVTVSTDQVKLYKGDRISLTSRIRSIKNFNNPGGFDYKRYMVFQQVWGTAYVTQDGLSILERDDAKGIEKYINSARQTLCDQIDQIRSTEAKAVYKALIVGDRSSISPQLRQAFNRTGVGHLLAISGLHIGIVASAAFMLLVWIFSFCRALLWHAYTRKAAAVSSLVPVFIYSLLAGMSPSTQRALIMVSLFLLTFLFERQHDLMNTLALAAMLILLVDAPSIFSVSFQLSFTAVFAIAYGLSRIERPWLIRASEVKHSQLFRFRKKLFYFFWASVFAILGTAPIMMFYFNQVSIVGLGTNLLAVPAVGFVVVPLGLAAVFVSPLTACGASCFLRAGAIVLDQVLTIIKWSADLSFCVVTTVTPSYFEIFLYYAFFWALLNQKPSRLRSKAPARTNLPDMPSNEQGLTTTKAARIILVFLIMAGISDALYWLDHRFWHDDLRVTVMDVGRGSAAFLELPGGHNLLIDGGGFSDNAIFDTGAQIIAPFLWRRKIKTVDTILLSHPNTDHLNGLIYIADHFNVQNAWTNNQPSSTAGYRQFINVIKKNNINYPAYHDMPRSFEINGVYLDILYPPTDFMAQSENEEWRSINNNSLVIKVTLGDISFLFPGDIDDRAEMELVRSSGNRLKSTVLLAPHHGSKTSGSSLFINAVNPETVIISSGKKSGSPSPRDSVLNRYRKFGAVIFETGRHGAIRMSTDGRSIKITPEILLTK